MLVLNFANHSNGLIPAVAQDYQTGEVLMLAYINQESWELTIETGRATYWSRSRKKIWQKGETSGHFQLVKDILVDCDCDAIIFKVEQVGDVACHTGNRSCFFRKIKNGELVPINVKQDSEGNTPSC